MHSNSMVYRERKVKGKVAPRAGIMPEYPPSTNMPSMLSLWMPELHHARIQGNGCGYFSVSHDSKFISSSLYSTFQDILKNIGTLFKK
jgi:hypothetical protein